MHVLERSFLKSYLTRIFIGLSSAEHGVGDSGRADFQLSALFLRQQRHLNLQDAVGAFALLGRSAPAGDLAHPAGRI